MNLDTPFQGTLFVNDFLSESIVDTPDWQAIDDDALATLEASLREVFDHFPIDGSPNESQTEDDLIWLVLVQLGWTASLRQQNLSARGREDVPDGLLFPDESEKDRANGFAEEWKRYELGLAIVESKRWLRPLDRRSGRQHEETAPSTQMQRYLRRIDDLTAGKVRWGILTNGAKWRLYYQGAQSVSEEFFELDLATLLDLPNHNGGLFALSDAERHHWLKVFTLVFRREAFLSGATDPRTFHQRAIEVGRFYEERVAASLSDLVFSQVFPKLARVIAAAAPDARLLEVRDAVLVLLYRLLFILYAEDRGLLPVRDSRYDDYALRDKVRGDVGRRKDLDDAFSETAARYWSAIDDLCRAIDKGDISIGLPPYNGGLFDRERAPILDRIRLGDQVMADVIDALSFEQGPLGRRYINYRDLGVRQLGSIYERLLEHELTVEDGEVVIRPNIFARKGSGSYYTPDDLVNLIIEETVEPLVCLRLEAFEQEARPLPEDAPGREQVTARLRELDPAEALLELKVCDPAIGSGHFLVGLVDYLADRVITAMAEAEAAVDGYISPLADRIQIIRETILAKAKDRDWAIDPDRLDDRHIVRRMVLKRCVFGVDKNPMAVELAKVALWLHTFTVGAPLSFLDHHLRCGDSLFGAWARSGIGKAKEYGSPLLLHASVARAEQAAESMRMIEDMTDAEIAEAHRSAEAFAVVEESTAPLNAILSLVHAIDWLEVRDRDGKAALQAFFAGQFGDPIDIVLGKADVPAERSEGERFSELLKEVRLLLSEERFLHWQAAFPGVWIDWENAGHSGGFDAVIGNPPWDRMKLQQVEWFAARKREIALAPRAADRKRMIADLEKNDDPLARDFALASERAASATRVARRSGEYPLLSGGDVNLYSLFVERAMTLVKPDGMVGLLTPSGVASDKTAARFFKGVATEGRLKALYDFENRRTRYQAPPFFPDVDMPHSSSASFIASPSPQSPMMSAQLRLLPSGRVSELDDPERCFPSDSGRVRPCQPKHRHRADLPHPARRGTDDGDLWPPAGAGGPLIRGGGEGLAGEVHDRMFDMTNDSGLFRTRTELEEEEGAYPIGGNRFASPAGEWVPLYVGRMIHQFDHRAASVEVNAENLHNVALSGDISVEQKADPAFVPTPQYWVLGMSVLFPSGIKWTIAFRDIARATDARTMIAAAVPLVGLGNTATGSLSVRKWAEIHTSFPAPIDASQSWSNRLLDFVARQKAQSTQP